MGRNADKLIYFDSIASSVGREDLSASLLARKKKIADRAAAVAAAALAAKKAAEEEIKNQTDMEIRLEQLSLDESNLSLGELSENKFIKGKAPPRPALAPKEEVEDNTEPAVSIHPRPRELPVDNNGIPHLPRGGPNVLKVDMLPQAEGALPAPLSGPELTPETTVVDGGAVAVTVSPPGRASESEQPTPQGSKSLRERKIDSVHAPKPATRRDDSPNGIFLIFGKFSHHFSQVGLVQ